MTRTRKLTLLLAASLSLTGCFSESTGGGPAPPTFAPSPGGPVVLGARATVSLVPSDIAVSEGWVLTSSNPDVVRIDRQAGGMADLVAAAEGTSTLGILRGDEVLAEREVQILAADRVELREAGRLRVRGDRAAVTAEPRVVVSGTGTYQVVYFRDGQPLEGSGALEVDAGAGLVAVPAPRLLEWIDVTATAPGAHALGLSAGGVELPSVSVHGVGPEAIRSVRIVAEREASAADGDRRFAIAQALDAEGRLIDGVAFTWRLGGEPAEDAGDAFEYEVARGSRVALEATASMTSEPVMISARDGRVTRSNTMVCSATPGARSGAPVALLALLCAAGVARGRSRPGRRR